MKMSGIEKVNPRGAPTLPSVFPIVSEAASSEENGSSGIQLLRSCLSSVLFSDLFLSEPG